MSGRLKLSLRSQFLPWLARAIGEGVHDGQTLVCEAAERLNAVPGVRAAILRKGDVTIAGRVPPGHREVHHLPIMAGSRGTQPWGHLALELSLAADDDWRSWLETVGCQFSLALHYSKLTGASEAEVRLALDKKTEELDAFFTTALDLLSLCTLDGEFVRLNLAWEQCLGYSLENLLTRTFESLVHPEDLASWREALAKLRSQQPVVNLVNRLLHSDGFYRWVEWRGNAVGGLVYWAGRDITERKQMEEALLASEERFRCAFESASIGMALLLPSGTWLQINESLCQILGYDESELLTRRLQDVADPADLETYMAQRTEILQGRRGSIQMQMRFTHRDGHTVWVQLSMAAVRDGRRDPSHLVVQLQDVSEAISAEIRLREERDFRLNIENTIAEGISMCDAQGRLVYVNPAFCRMVGWEAEEMLGQFPPRPYWPDEEVAHIQELFDLTQQGHAPSPLLELVFRRRNGERFDVHLLVAQTRHKGQDMVLTSFFEISERKRAERALKQSEERFRIITQNVPGAIFRIVRGSAGDRSLTYLSPHGKDIFEHPAELENIDYFWSLTHPEDVEFLRDSLHSLEHGLEPGLPPIAWEFRIVTPSGRTKWIRVLSKPSPQADGSICWDGFLEDISARKQSDFELRDSEQRYVSLASALPVGIFRTDLEGRVFYFNRRCKEICDLSDEELTAGWAEAIHPEDRERSNRDWRECLTHRTGFAMEFRFWQPQRAAQDVRWVYCQALLERDASGEVVGFVGSLTDITAQKETEAQLQAARLQAEAASRAKSDFLAAMSHEIRTPMTAVIGMTGLLLDSELNYQQKEYSETIQQSGEILLTLINDILDYSKIEAGRMELETLNFELRRVVEEVTDLMSTSASAKEIELLSLVTPEVPPTLGGDPGRIRQVLLNLVSNAVKFTQSGGEVWVRLSLVDPLEAAEEGVTRVPLPRGERGEASPGAAAPQGFSHSGPRSGASGGEGVTRVWVRAEVTDTGVGIPYTSQGKLFQPFSQADSSTTRTHGGTGLGLSISKRLVELMGGGIGFTSVPEQGSRFWFILPLETRPCLETSGIQALAGQRLLAVGLQPSLAQFVVEHGLDWSLDCQLSTLDDASIFLSRATFSGLPFNAILLDNDPACEGLAWLSQQRSNQTSLPPVIVIAPRARRPSMDLLTQLGAASCLIRPVRPSQLYAALLTALAGGSPQAAAEARAMALSEAQLEDAQNLSLRAARILVAEDNPTNQRVVMHLLRRLGYRADFAANGVEVLQALERNPSYALILMDCQMPEMDGYQATREIRRRELENSGEIRHIPIISLTAAAFNEDRDLCLEAGMDDYLAKPVRPNELKAALQRWLHFEGKQAAV